LRSRASYGAADDMRHNSAPYSAFREVFFGFTYVASRVA